MSKYTYLIFDLDGCLIDSSEVQRAAFFESYQEIVGDERCPSYEEYIKCTGDSVEGMLRTLGLPKEMATPFRRISNELVDKIIVNYEIIEAIRNFRERGCKVAICTGKDHNRTVDILRYYKIEELFDALVCADDVFEHKPSPMPIIMTMKLLEANRQETIMIGDGYNDILSAKSANVDSVLALWYGDNGVPLEANYVARNASELIRIIDGVQ